MISGGLAEAVDNIQALGVLGLTFIEHLKRSWHPIVGVQPNMTAGVIAMLAGSGRLDRQPKS